MSQNIPMSHSIILILRIVLTLPRYKAVNVSRFNVSMFQCVNVCHIVSRFNGCVSNCKECVKPQT